LAALQAFAIASGWEQSSFMRRHFLGRALVSTIVHVHLCKQKMQEKHTECQTIFQSFFCCSGVYQFSCTFKKKANTWLMLQVPVPPEWVDALFPRVTALLTQCKQGMPGCSLAKGKQMT